MKTWNPKTHCLTTWKPASWPQPIQFSGWGCELGNWFGFFAQERESGYKCQIAAKHLPPAGDSTLGSSWAIQLPKAQLHLDTLDTFVGADQIQRSLVVENRSREVAWIGDAVIRLVVPWEEGLVALLEDRELTHAGSNLHYETEEPEVALQWPDGRRLIVRWHDRAAAPPTFTPYLYVRDMPRQAHPGNPGAASPAWVIHARLLVDYPAALVFRYWRDPFVFWSRGIFGRYFVSAKNFRNYWRGGEIQKSARKYLYGIWPLVPHDVLRLNMEIEALS